MKKNRKRYPNKKRGGKVDVGLLVAVVVLTIFGVVMVYDASVVEAYQQFSDKFYFARLQAIWAGVGLLGLVAAMLAPRKWLMKIAPVVFLVTLTFLVLVLVPGFSSQVKGARRWLMLGPLKLQPSELAKIALVMYLSSWLTKHQRVAPFLAISILMLGLVMLEPDLGTAVVIAATGLVVYFLSGADIKMLIILAVLGGVVGSMLVLGSDYRRARLKTFLDPTSDPLGSSYHIRQVLIALGSGGLFGQGVGRSRQKYQYLPEATTDSIFAVVSEEIGFIGAAGLIGVLLFIISRGFIVAKKAPDTFSYLLASGVTSWLAIQVIINLSAMVALVPLTGVPLPFVSYGGSSLITALVGVGLLLNVSRG